MTCPATMRPAPTIGITTILRNPSPLSASTRVSQVDACSFLGRPVASPLGIAAGPLLNGKWLLYYAQLGFDVLTYKTVRSRAHACYALPNLQPVLARDVAAGQRIAAADTMDGSWAISFGMPSSPPDVWRADVQATRHALARDKVLSVSVVATPEADWTLEQIADDYALAARWAAESGADCIEANFSCPNVQSVDGQLYLSPAAACLVASRVKRAIAGLPLIIKIGHIPDEKPAAKLLDAIGTVVDGLSMTNCIAAQVHRDGRDMFRGESRGIGGHAIRRASIEQVGLFARLIRDRQLPIQLIGVGGVFTAEHVRQYLDAGAAAVHLATAPMLDPSVGMTINRELCRG